MRCHGAAHTDGAAQLLGLRAGETRHGHGHAQKLLLKERYAERALQHRLQRGMRIGDLFFALTAAHIRVHHFADDGTGANDGHLHHQIVEARRSVEGKEAICARLSTWNIPTVSALRSVS